MARFSLEKAREVFERQFDEVHIYDPKTHPPGVHPSRTPNGVEYLTIIDSKLMIEGEAAPRRILNELDAAEAWYGAISALYRLRGAPPYLWWRVVPIFEGGIENSHIYSRFAMTFNGAPPQYTGLPALKFVAADHHGRILDAALQPEPQANGQGEP